jgi:uncharacterized RDD family membrane protein YckC/DNA-directed RNA polymerase subunit RPC12/RpoP
METNTSVGQDARAICAECGKPFRVGDMIRHGAAYVCATCKPIFMQKLAEGATISSGKMRYAGFWRRFVAVLIDGIALFIVAIAVQFAIALSSGQSFGTAPLSPGLLLIQQLSGLMVGILYETIMIGQFGATLGKMALNVHVVTADGGRVSYARSFGRYFAKLLSAFTLLIGYIIAGFDLEHRALHDRICNTRVVMD